jgi:2-phosphosulfolactate phosphatase
MLATQSAVRPLLGGERQGRRIEGFDLGNSPAEYTPEVVDQRSIVFTTTNGTRAMAAAAGADRILLGAFVNLTALVDQLADDQRPLQLVCAGTNGEETSEDILFAGAVVDRLSQLGRSPRNPAARLARTQWQQLSPAELARQLESSRGGQNLVAAGLSADIGLAAQLDAWPVVGELDSEQMIVSRSQVPPPVAPQADTG